MPEIISDKELTKGRVAAGNATTGVSGGHDKGFNQVKLSTTTPNESEKAAPDPDDEAFPGSEPARKT